MKISVATDKVSTAFISSDNNATLDMLEMLKPDHNNDNYYDDYLFYELEDFPGDYMHKDII